jgi:glyoxylase-like metal-dependent hydrolase (beta-lactamase superfamily II)
MAYTGDVTPRGVPDVRELEHLTITKYAVDPQMANNCYLLRCRSTGDQLLIDAADGDRTVGDGDTVAVGSCELRVIAVAGHTPGSICLVYDDPGGHPHLFTGDSLFPGGVGATFGDDAAFRQLVDEVETKLFGTLPGNTWFYPGHGGDSTLGAERPHLAEWRERGW